MVLVLRSRSAVKLAGLSSSIVRSSMLPCGRGADQPGAIDRQPDAKSVRQPVPGNFAAELLGNRHAGKDTAEPFVIGCAVDARTAAFLPRQQDPIRGFGNGDFDMAGRTDKAPY